MEACQLAIASLRGRAAREEALGASAWPPCEQRTVRAGRPVRKARWHGRPIAGALGRKRQPANHRGQGGVTRRQPALRPVSALEWREGAGDTPRMSTGSDAEGREVLGRPAGQLVIGGMGAIGDAGAEGRAPRAGALQDGEHGRPNRQEKRQFDRPSSGVRVGACACEKLDPRSSRRHQHIAYGAAMASEQQERRHELERGAKISRIEILS
eukprot:CAMPEP_0179923974 /NCGR_PEP_ID=MMETSP0983-20121128/6466_1 /TAXON_ID=483367 /ORGANISM="non described non described, Strain CCMP 2436" /LENGTH=210 /DNA_ID=CAMNT_0021827439 /DNA_START=293 /DNA_END=920 /DNA_ORIENTATION=-